MVFVGERAVNCYPEWYGTILEAENDEDAKALHALLSCLSDKDRDDIVTDLTGHWQSPDSRSRTNKPGDPKYLDIATFMFGNYE